MKLKALLKKVYFYSLPNNALVRTVFAVLDRGIEAFRFVWEWFVKTFWVEPRFRSRYQAGKSLWMENSPFISGRGEIVLGEGVRISGKIGIAFMPVEGNEPKLCIGANTFVGVNCAFSTAESIVVGENCLLAAETVIRDNDGHPLDAVRRRENHLLNPDEVKAVTIGDDVWVGNRAMILKGVSIGDRAIVASCAVVTKDVAADTIVAGNPARVVRELPRSAEGAG
ncbi:MAG: hypothetical protein CML13_10790 [Puniceicoccaceae bacterium]|nr:hypothetical protein [Puniceicoccaceae bacterium]|tara:strand:- start:48071 stop:48745 length:675 start_codon:yes stop_codon:yes gene_type:complete